MPALLNPGKVTLVIEPILNDQIKTLTSIGVDTVTLGGAAGNDSKKNFNRVFGVRDLDYVPQLAFCTSVSKCHPFLMKASMISA